MKKTLAIVLSLVLALTMAFALVACAPTTEPNPNPTPDPGKDDDKTVTYTITINGVAKDYEKDADVTATATVETGKEFKQWNDADGNKVSTENPYTFKATADTTLTAIFNDTKFDVTVAGGLLDNSLTTGSYVYNTDATATATIPDGYSFLRWVDLAGEEVSTANPYTFKVTAETSISALFKAPELVDGKAMIEVQNGVIKSTNLPFGEIAPETELTVVATVPAGYAFVGWVDVDGNTLGSDLEYTFEVSVSVTLIAKMAAVKTITLEAESCNFTGLQSPGYSGDFAGLAMLSDTTNYAGNTDFINSISNGWFIKETNSAGLNFKFVVDADMAASGAQLTLRLASAMRVKRTLDNASFDVKINGVSLDYTAFDITCGNGQEYSVPFQDFLLDATFDLVKGENTIELIVGDNDFAAEWGGTYQDAAGPGIDCIRITTYANLTHTNDMWEENYAGLTFGN